MTIRTVVNPNMSGNPYLLAYSEILYNKKCKIFSATSFGQKHTAKIDFNSLMGKSSLGSYHCPFFPKRPIASVTFKFRTRTSIIPSARGAVSFWESCITDLHFSSDFR